MATTTAQRPKMTANQARSFRTISESSVLQIVTKITTRCGCEPYTDVFTFKRWKAQGFSVRKGEKSTHLDTFVPMTRKNADGELEEVRGEDDKVRLVPRSLPVFCRHQVEEESR